MKHILSKPCKRAVINYLFDNDLTNCPFMFDTELEKLMDSDYNRIHSVNLSKDSKDFMELCKDFGFDPGNKQIEISDNEVVLTPYQVIYKPDEEEEVTNSQIKENTDWWMTFI